MNRAEKYLLPPYVVALGGTLGAIEGAAFVFVTRVNKELWDSLNSPQAQTITQHIGNIFTNTEQTIRTNPNFIWYPAEGMALLTSTVLLIGVATGARRLMTNNSNQG